MYILEDDPSALHAWIRDEVAFPGEVGPLSDHASVKRVQEWLCLHNMGLVIDGDYGPVTEHTLKCYQFANGLGVTGTGYDSTWHALIRPMTDALTNPLSVSIGYCDAIVAFATQHLNVHPREVGGANAGPWVRLYMEGHEGETMLWCAGFVSFCMAQAANALDQPKPVEGTFSCDELAGQGQDAGIFVKEDEVTPTELTPGSIFLRRASPGDWTHVGIVTSAGNGHYETIEGNTNDEGTRNGYEVCARRRGYANTDFIVL